MSHGVPIEILIADDDEDDRLLIADAIEESRLNNPVHFVKDGVELMDYLKREGDYAGEAGKPLPGLILLDLNMPRKDGRAALSEIRADKDLCRIPVVVLTTSQADEDVLRTYGLGVNSFITKPVSFAGLVDIVRVLGQYWFEIVVLPPDA